MNSNFTSLDARGLDAIPHVSLDEAHANMLEAAKAACGGDAAFRARKIGEATQTLAMSQLAPGRLQVGAFDLVSDFKALLFMRTPVPVRPNDRNELRVAHNAILGLTYPHAAVGHPMPGSAFVQILEPRNVWLPQVLQPEQQLCLAPTLPAGIRVKLIILMAYNALCLKNHQFDETDPAGVFSKEPAVWWQSNQHRVPLSKEPFFSDAAVGRTSHRSQEIAQ